MVYKYRPVSVEALKELISWELKGEQAQARRYICDMLHIIAAGKRLNDDIQGSKFTDLIEDLYKSPFKVKSCETGQDIVSALLRGYYDETV